jgi:hypothetical protein
MPVMGRGTGRQWESSLSLCSIAKRSEKRAIKMADLAKKVGNFFRQPVSAAV